LALRPSVHARRAGGIRAVARTPIKVTAVSGGEVPLNLTTWCLEQERLGVIDNELAVVITSIASSCKRISSLVARAPIAGMIGLAGESNASGDEQKKLDLIANEVFTSCLSDCGRTGTIVSEEFDTPIAIESCNLGDYIVCFDPIDGSSNIDAAVTTGSIFAVYDPGECELDFGDDAETMVSKCITNVQQAGDEIRVAGYCMYSSSTVFVLTVGDGVFGFTLDTVIGEFVMSHERIQIPDPGQRIYSGNQGNIDLWAPELKKYVEEVLQAGPNPYTYRYIGALVGDFHRTLLYGGIWLYPPDSLAPQGKARLLYEVAPMAYIAEQAGGLAHWGPLADQRVLEVVPTSVHQKSPLFTGSASEVDNLSEFLSKQGVKA